MKKNLKSIQQSIQKQMLLKALQNGIKKETSFKADNEKLSKILWSNSLKKDKTLLCQTHATRNNVLSGTTSEGTLVPF